MKLNKDTIKDYKFTYYEDFFGKTIKFNIMGDSAYEKHIDEEYKENETNESLKDSSKGFHYYHECNVKIQYGIAKGFKIFYDLTGATLWHEITHEIELLMPSSISEGEWTSTVAEYLFLYKEKLDKIMKEFKKDAISKQQAK